MNEGCVDVDVEEVLAKVGREGGWNLEEEGGFELTGGLSRRMTTVNSARQINRDKYTQFAHKY